MLGISRRHLIIALSFGLACGAALVILPRLLVGSSFFYFYDSLKGLFYAQIGMSAAISEASALALVFFFPLATYVFFANILAVWTNRAGLSRLLKVFAAYALIYILPAVEIALNDTFGSLNYFDQKT